MSVKSHPIPSPAISCSCCEEDVAEGVLPPSRVWVLGGEVPVLFCERCDATPTHPNPVVVCSRCDTPMLMGRCCSECGGVKYR